MLPVVRRGFLHGRSSSRIIRSSEPPEEAADGVGGQIQSSSACFGLLRSIFGSFSLGTDSMCSYTFRSIYNMCKVRVLDWYSCIPTFPSKFLHFLESLSWVVSKTLRALSLQKCSFHVLPVRNVTRTIVLIYFNL